MNNQPTQTKRDLVITRVFDAPVEQVWKAWTDDEQVKRWWGPNFFTAPYAKIDLREGGVSLVCMRAPQEFGGMDYYNTWTYGEIVPLKRIEFFSHISDDQGRAVDPTSLELPADFPQGIRSVLEFKALDGGRTELTVTEFDYDLASKHYDLSKQGMEECLEKMAATFN